MLTPYKTAFQFKKNGFSPWGIVEQVDSIAEGIFRIHTASHGGIGLSVERQAQLAEQSPHLLRAVEGKAYCPKPMWWEEDCEAAIPLLAFWDDLPEQMRRESYYQSLVRAANHTYGLTLSGRA